MRTYRIQDFGACGDGRTLATRSIQSAIDKCSAEGGGRVLIEDGVFMTGTIVLKKGVDLHIEQNGRLLGSPHCEDYPEFEKKHVSIPMLPRKRSAALIFAEECENISITGHGVIDGNGEAFVTPQPVEAYNHRWSVVRIDAPTPPRVVFFTGCRNVLVEDVTMVNQPAGWSYWIHDCDYVSFERCKVIANVNYPNNDGIHINSSRNVTVSNCCITCGDDCLIVRANNASLSEKKICEKVTVTNCNFTSYSSGIRIGWINDGVIRNCVFSNIVMTDTTVGINIWLPGHSTPDRIPDEGVEATRIENLIFDNIVMDGVYFYPIKMLIADTPVTKCDAIRNISFRGIRATGLHFPMLYGRKSNPIENISISDSSFEVVPFEKCRLGAIRALPAPFDKNDEKNFIVRYVNNLSLNNTTFSSAET